MTRYAIVAGNELSAVDSYMPGNYRVIGRMPAADPITGSHTQDIVIAGEDNAGWTLDDYVLPRLASGLHFRQ